jgi:membrane protein YdbS with pleckstrin-like domain
LGEEITLKPTARSFTKFYLESLTPLILLAIIEWASKKLPLISNIYYIYFILGVLLLAWVFRSRFVTASVGLFILFIIGSIGWYIHVHNISFTDIEGMVTAFRDVVENYLPEVTRKSAIASSLLVLLYAESFRRSIKYIISKGGVTISGGIARKQEVFYPYTQISNAVVERGILARLLGYGTVILVSTGGWGNEMYTRMVGGGVVGSHNIGVGVGYARTLQEVSRDPLKCLYGVPKPNKVAEVIKSKLAFTYEALEKQTSLLEEIARNTRGEKKET